MILIGRALCSAVSSISVPAAYSYVAEIANSSNRGFLGSLLSVGWTFGLVISYTLGSVLDWNFLALSACTVPIAQLIVLWVLSMSLLDHQIYLVRFYSQVSIKQVSSLNYFEKFFHPAPAY